LNYLETWAPQTLNKNSDDLGLTFRDSKGLPVHRWYPYVEGFSADYIESLMAGLSPDSGAVYDPFGGSGTVCAIASKLGIKSQFSELNPYMRFVTETKVNSARWAAQHAKETQVTINRALNKLNSQQFQRLAQQADLSEYHRTFPERDFFRESHLRQLLAARKMFIEVSKDSKHLQSLLLLAISSVLVHNSNMTRRADLRRRKPDEYKTRKVNVKRSLEAKLMEMSADLATVKPRSATTRFVNGDARAFSKTNVNSFEKIITSPPYLNGTNYFRNTKIELWFLGFITDENDLSKFNDNCICAGINNVSNRRNEVGEFQDVEAVVEKLNATDGDKRIGKMVRQYFSDMLKVLKNCNDYLKPGGQLHLDIGDSKFYGVHVPTDKLLIQIAEAAGLAIVNSKVLARRHSRDKTPLTQVELTFEPSRS
jgi:hypothetical protein